ncbi:MAG TPA: hypothetical protein VI391_02950, partial [Thermoanaerobaculia bacterium]
SIAVRVNISNATGDGTVYLTPLGWGEFAGTPVIGYLKGDTNIGEESAVMVRNSGIIVGALNGGTDLTVELLGFFVEDKTTPQPTPCVSGSYQLPNMTASTVFPTLRVNDRCVTANSLVMVNSSGLFGVTVNAQGDGWVEFTGLGGQAFRYIVFGGKP